MSVQISYMFKLYIYIYNIMQIALYYSSFYVRFSVQPDDVYIKP